VRHKRGADVGTQMLRTRLRGRVPDLKFVFLEISLPEAIQRASQRQGHEFPVTLVADRIDALESPAGDALGSGRVGDAASSSTRRPDRVDVFLFKALTRPRHRSP
jgi:gluconate kinase